MSSELKTQLAQCQSPWITTTTLPTLFPLQENTHADVCIVGAGIAGLTTAYQLIQAGKSVIVIDDGDIAGGMTEVTTAHLSNALDDRYLEIERLHGETGARLAAGGTFGKLVGSAMPVVLFAATGGAIVVAAGPLLAGTGAMVGGFVGAMTTRGVGRELVDYYEQAVIAEKILVAAENHTSDPNPKLAEAEQIFIQAGAQPIRLEADILP